MATVDTTIDPFPLGPWRSPTHAFIWRNGVKQDLGTLGGLDSFPTGGCNNERSDLVVGWSFTNSTANASTGIPTQHAFVWDHGKMTDIPTLGGTFAFAQCTNNQAQVIGQSSLVGDVGCAPSDLLNTCDEHAFSWNHGTLTDLGTLGGSFSVANWLNNQGEAVGGATTTNDESFHATLWRNGQITDLGTFDGDCASVGVAINSKGQVIGLSFNCDTNTLRMVLWENGSMIDLNAAIPSNSSLFLIEPDNINERGEIVGRGLPPGCDDLDMCGHVFLLIPCASGQGCEGTNDIIARTASPAVSIGTTTRTQRRQMTKEFVAHLRARFSRRYHIPGLRASTQD
jgi:probable HAF family extracellular repeat protein